MTADRRWLAERRRADRLEALLRGLVTAGTVPDARRALADAVTALRLPDDYLPAGADEEVAA